MESKVGYVTINYESIGGVSKLSKITEILLSQQYHVISCNIYDNLFDNILALSRCEKIVFSVGNVYSLLTKRTLLYIVILSTLRKKLIFRGFAGGLRLNMSRSRRLFIPVVARFFSVITFETIADVAYFRDIISGSTRVIWLPNHRSLQVLDRKERIEQIAYFGRLNKTKGLDALATYSALKNIKAVAFGPVDKNYVIPEGIEYLGVLDNKGIELAMKKYAFVFLSTSWPTEGYPGVLLEAHVYQAKIIANVHNDMAEIFLPNGGDKGLKERKIREDLPQIFDDIAYLTKWKIILGF